MSALLCAAAATALAPGVLAQDQDETGNATGAEDAQSDTRPAQENATATNVTPGEQSESELPTERSRIGDVPPAELGDDPNVAPERQFQDEPQEAGAAQTFLFAGLWIASSIVLAFLALLGVAYASYRRGGAHR